MSKGRSADCGPGLDQSAGLELSLPGMPTSAGLSPEVIACARVTVRAIMVRLAEARAQRKTMAAVDAESADQQKAFVQLQRSFSSVKGGDRVLTQLVITEAAAHGLQIADLVAMLRTGQRYGRR